MRQIACGYDVTGTVRNLADGRVELVAEAPRPELEAFLQAIDESELSGFIGGKKVDWQEGKGNLRGFGIAH